MAVTWYEVIRLKGFELAVQVQNFGGRPSCLISGQNRKFVCSHKNTLGAFFSSDCGFLIESSPRTSSVEIILRGD